MSDPTSFSPVSGLAITQEAEQYVGYADRHGWAFLDGVRIVRGLLEEIARLQQELSSRVVVNAESEVIR